MAKHLFHSSPDVGQRRIRIRFDDPKLGPKIMLARKKMRVYGDGKHLLLTDSKKPKRRWLVAVPVIAIATLTAIITVKPAATQFDSPVAIDCFDDLAKGVVEPSADDLKLGGVTTKRVVCNQEPYRLTIDAVKRTVIDVKKL